MPVVANASTSNRSRSRSCSRAISLSGSGSALGSDGAEEARSPRSCERSHLTFLSCRARRVGQGRAPRRKKRTRREEGSSERDQGLDRVGRRQGRPSRDRRQRGCGETGLTMRSATTNKRLSGCSMQATLRIALRVCKFPSPFMRGDLARCSLVARAGAAGMSPRRSSGGRRTAMQSGCRSRVARDLA